MSLTLCVLLWPHPGAEDALVAYEDRVLALLPDHGARLLHRVRATGPRGTDDEPFEVHLLELPSEAALEAYLGDPRRRALTAERERAIARTRLVRIEPV